MNNIEVGLYVQFLVDIIRMYHYHSCGFISDIELFKLEEGNTPEELRKKLYEIRCNAMDKSKKEEKAMAKVKVFISGPITGYEDNNRAKFYEAERILRGLGFDVFNPVWMDFTDSWDHEEIMSVDLAALATCDAIYQLEGWEHSKGALKEFYFAIDHNKDFVTYESLPDDMKFLRESVRVGAPTGVAARMRDAYIARGGIINMHNRAPVRP